MSDIESYKAILAEIADVLDCGGDLLFAQVVRGGLTGTEESVNEFLISNDLWGGSGSVADSGLTSAPKDLPDSDESRATFQRLMIKLGRRQIASDHVNVRTKMWVEAFESWSASSIS